jgi:phosphate transport system substrate-binding protein
MLVCFFDKGCLNKLLMKLSKSLRTLPLLLAFATVSATTPLLVHHAIAQDAPAPSFSMPTEVPSGTTLKIQGSSSMEQFTTSLANSFQSKFPAAKVENSTVSSDEALKALLDGKADLVAIGRPLTADEKAQGLTSVTIARNKIAMIVGKNNPFQKGLDINLFAKIFRGEITDWKDAGGEPGPIRLIDRPETSDTRQSFADYPVFQSAPFNTGSTAVGAKDDTTPAVVQELGTDGIGFAIADQVTNNPDVRVVPMHNVMPDDKRYPFSQPLQYVYAGEAKPSVQAFLGYLTAPENQALVEKARLAAVGGTAPVASATSSPGASPTSTAASPTTALAPSDPATSTPSTETGGMPGWLPWALLAIPAAGLAWWALKGKGEGEPTAAAPTTIPAADIPATQPPTAPLAAAAATAVAGATAVAAGATAVATGGRTVASRPLKRRLILTPRNSRDAYAYWEVDEQIKEELRNQGGEQLKLRLTDVTNLPAGQTAPVIGEFNCQENDPDLHVPITTPNRDYQAELGYRTAEGRWLSIAKSDPVLVPNASSYTSTPTVSSAATSPATPIEGGLKNIGTAIAGAGAAVAGAAGLGAAAQALTPDASPDSDEDGGLFGGLLDQVTDKAKDLAGNVVDTTTNLTSGVSGAIDGGLDSISELLSGGDSSAPTSLESNAVEDNDLFGEGLFGGLLDQVTDKAKDLAGNVVDTTTNLAGGALGTGAAAVGGVAAAGAAGIGAVSQVFNRTGSTAPQPEMAKDCRIILVPRNSQDGYAYWEVADKYKSVLRQQGGQRLVLRVHDATNIDIDSQAPHSTQEYPVLENQQDLHVKIPTTGRDYVVELGYYTADNRWMRIIRSLHVHVA